MNRDGKNFLIGGICRPYGARLLVGMRATKLPLLTELAEQI